MNATDKKHLIFGSSLFALAIVGAYLYNHNRVNTAVATGDNGEPLITSNGATIPTYPVAQSAVPGVDINMGGSPTYMTYNMPQAQSYLPAPTAITPPPPISASSGCGCAGEPDQSFHSVSDNLASSVPMAYSDLQSTGVLTQPTGQFMGILGSED